MPRMIRADEQATCRFMDLEVAPIPNRFVEESEVTLLGPFAAAGEGPAPSLWLETGVTCRREKGG